MTLTIAIAAVLAGVAVVDVSGIDPAKLELKNCKVEAVT